MERDTVRFVLGSFLMAVATGAATYFGFGTFHEMMHAEPISGTAAAISFLVMVAAAACCVAVMRR